jgi:hypothetical protein
MRMQLELKKNLPLFFIFSPRVWRLRRLWRLQRAATDQIRNRVLHCTAAWLVFRRQVQRRLEERVPVQL